MNRVYGTNPHAKAGYHVRLEFNLKEKKVTVKAVGAAQIETPDFSP
jgi:hypothetical protein